MTEVTQTKLVELQESISTRLLSQDNVGDSNGVKAGLDAVEQIERIVGTSHVAKAMVHDTHSHKK